MSLRVWYRNAVLDCSRCLQTFPFVAQHRDPCSLFALSFPLSVRSLLIGFCKPSSSSNPTYQEAVSSSSQLRHFDWEERPRSQTLLSRRLLLGNYLACLRSLPLPSIRLALDYPRLLPASSKLAAHSSSSQLTVSRPTSDHHHPVSLLRGYVSNHGNVEGAGVPCCSCKTYHRIV